MGVERFGYRKSMGAVVAIALGTMAFTSGWALGLPRLWQAGFGGGAGGGLGEAGKTRAILQQGGGLGGGFFGGQGQAGALGGTFDNRVEALFTSGFRSSILTPGEFVEWKLDLKAGEMLVAEATSTAFDPAMEVIDDKEKVLQANDDRYPGDQRPLIFFRVPADGAYRLRVRCYHDKSGGQASVRFRSYPCLDADGPLHDVKVREASTFAHLHMKAGEIRELVWEPGKSNPGLTFVVREVFSSFGLPSPQLLGAMAPAMGSGHQYLFMAPVDGDDYALIGHGGVADDTLSAGAGAGGFGVARSGKGMTNQPIRPQEEATGPLRDLSIGSRTVEAKRLDLADGRATTDGAMNEPNLYELKLKAGTFLQLSAPELKSGCAFEEMARPDVSKFDVTKPEVNPFDPNMKVEQPSVDISPLPLRSRDGRVSGIVVRGDTTLWLGVRGGGPAGKKFALTVSPGATPLAEDKATSAELKIDHTEYWSFDPKAGDVMTMEARSKAFVESLRLYDPELGQIADYTVEPGDEPEAVSRWNFVVQRPGRYLVSIGCLGEGGSGSYSLHRVTVPAKEFGPGRVASGSLSNGQVQCWKFTMEPTGKAAPLLVHWRGEGDLETEVYYDNGGRADISRTGVSPSEDYSIIAPTSLKRTYVIVFRGNGAKAAKYEVSLAPLAVKSLKN
jgi:hypothetical protein